MQIIDIFMSEEIERLARMKPKFLRGPNDVGCLMDYLPKLQIRAFCRDKNKDLETLESWKADFKARNIPFVVVRVNGKIVKLYKERKADNNTNKRDMPPQDFDN